MFNGGGDAWLDVGNKSVGVACLQAYFDFPSQNCLHVGDQVAGYLVGGLWLLRSHLLMYVGIALVTLHNYFVIGTIVKGNHFMRIIYVCVNVYTDDLTFFFNTLSLYICMYVCTYVCVFQFLKTGNDLAARDTCPCIWITNPRETGKVLQYVLNFMEIRSVPSIES